LVDRTKTGEVHVIPCAKDFKPYMKTMQSNHFSPYFFTCSESRVEGKRYTEKVYRRVWKEACDKTGENIDVYRGTKTTRASQLMNEVGLSAAGGIESDTLRKFIDGYGKRPVIRLVKV